MKKNSQPEFVASACLVGFNCKYNGKNNIRPELARLFREGGIIPICPETLSGLKAPRVPSEILEDGTVISKTGSDLTESFELGASRAMSLALQSGCKKAIVKSRSPSCGFGQIYDGSFSGKLRAGNGKWAEKLVQAGFTIWTEEDLPDLP